MGLVLYSALVGILFWKGNTWFGTVNRYLGPVFFLVLFIVSALICGLIALGYPAYLYLQHKQTKRALRLVGYTVAWLAWFTILIIMAVIYF